MRILRTGLVAGLLLACFPLEARQIDDRSLMDGIHAIVGDAIITLQQVYVYMRPSEEVLYQRYRNQPDYERRWMNLVNESSAILVRRQLILQDFQASGFKFPESIIDEIVTERIKDRYADRIQFTKELQQRGQTFESYRKEVRDQLIESEMSRKYVPDPVISPHKIEVYYQEHLGDFKVTEQVNLRMIVRNQTADAAPGSARKMCEEILGQIRGGASFAQMAEIYSEGSFRSQGGLTGLHEISTMNNKAIVDALKNLKPGAYSDVIESESPSACFLILLEERQPAHSKTLNEVRDEIEGKLRRTERARLDDKWIQRLKAKTLVRYPG